MKDFSPGTAATSTAELSSKGKATMVEKMWSEPKTARNVGVSRMSMKNAFVGGTTPESRIGRLAVMKTSLDKLNAEIASGKNE